MTVVINQSEIGTTLLRQAESNDDAPDRAIQSNLSKWFEGPLNLMAKLYFLLESWAIKRPLLFSIVHVTILFAIVFSIFTCGFETNDDAVMNMFVSGKGVSLQPDEHMVFSNVLIELVSKIFTLGLQLFPGTVSISSRFISLRTAQSCLQFFNRDTIG